jgi:hypothetical protein
MWPDDETPEPAAWINFNAATGERNVSFECESELASIPLWPEPPQFTKKRHISYACPICAASMLEDDTALIRLALEWIDAQPEPRMLGAAKIIVALRERLGETK